MKEARFSFSITVINLRHKNYGYPLSYTVCAKCPEATAGRLRFFAMEINKFDESARVMIEIVWQFFLDQVQTRSSVDH